MSSMTPQEIVHELDKHIVGQGKAKKAVAIALRNRWRRAQVAEPLRQEITPKNILMIGPTGVGKTEIARRLARLANAPFIKIEATKFTEVGYVGRDVETIIRDLVEIAVKSGREHAMKAVRARADDAAEDRILDVLLPPARGNFFNDAQATEDSATRQKFRKKLREGELDDKEIEIEVAAPSMQAEIFAPPGMEELTAQIQGMFQNMGGGAQEIAQAEDSARRASCSSRKKRRSWSMTRRSSSMRSATSSRTASSFSTRSTRLPPAAIRTALMSRVKGCSATCLPLVEGTTVSTKYGMIRTDHILFIASGAFHLGQTVGFDS
jgi:ATP-dependent HslUV protease ATP-binding subunit HslU